MTDLSTAPDLQGPAGLGSRRDLARLLTSYALTSVAAGLPWPLLLSLVWRDHGALAVGLAGAARMAPYVLLSWAVASLGDHVRRDRLVRITLGLRVACLSGCALAVGSDRTGLAVALAALAVTVGTPTYPTVAAALPTLAGPRRVRATELLVTCEVASWVVGPALGGLLLAGPTRPHAVVVATALGLAAWLLVIGLRLPAPTDRAADAVAGMLRAVVRSRPAVLALGLAATTNLVVTAAGLTLLPLAHEVWRTGEGGYGAATACLGFGALGAPLLARLVRPTAPSALVALGSAFLVVLATPLPWLALPVLAAAGATGVVVETLVTRTLQDAVPDRYRAGALGVADTVMVSACLVASLAAPALAALVGGRGALLIVVVVCGAAALALRRSSRRTTGVGADVGVDPDPSPVVAVGT